MHRYEGFGAFGEASMAVRMSTSSSVLLPSLASLRATAFAFTSPAPRAAAAAVSVVSAVCFDVANADNSSFLLLSPRSAPLVASSSVDTSNGVNGNFLYRSADRATSETWVIRSVHRERTDLLSSSSSSSSSAPFTTTSANSGPCAY